MKKLSVESEFSKNGGWQVAAFLCIVRYLLSQYKAGEKLPAEENEFSCQERCNSAMIQV